MMIFSFRQYPFFRTIQTLGYCVAIPLAFGTVSASGQQQLTALREQQQTTGDTLTVTGKTAGSHQAYQLSATGSKTTTPVPEIPQSVSVITRQQMDMLQPASVSQALRYTAGATSERYGSNGDHLDMTRIRGLEADYYLDGLPIIGNTGTWSNQIDPYTLSLVEVLRGPASFLYGQGSGGGIVNQLSRKPQALAAGELRIRYGSFNDKQLAADLTGAVNNNKSILYRFTLSARDAHGQIENSKHQRIYLAPAITFHPGNTINWTLLASYSREPETPNYNSIPAVFYSLNNSPYQQIDRHKNYTDSRFAHSSREQYSLSSLFNYDFNDNWRFVSNARYMYLKNSMQRGTVYGYKVTDNQPLFNGYYELAPASSATFTMDDYLRGDVNRGNVLHTLLAGVDFSTGNIKNALYSDGGHYFSPYGEIHHPHIIPDFTASFAAPWREKQNFTRAGVYLQDQIAWNNWRLTLSTRHDWSKTDDYLNSYSATSTLTQQNDTSLNGRAGLSYQFDMGIAPYISYATAFDPVLASNYKGEAFRPLQTRQAEAGVKYQPDSASALFSAALFLLNQQNVKTPDVDHRGFNTQAGEVRSRGIDLQARLEIIHNLNLIASYSWLDNQLVQDARYQGKSLTQVPAHSAAVWLDYLMDSGPLTGLKLATGVRYLGTSYADPDNSFKVPPVTLLDLAADYDLGQMAASLKGASLAINVNNLANSQYIASCTSQNYCFTGQDRTVSATLIWQW